MSILELDISKQFALIIYVYIFNTMKYEFQVYNINIMYYTYTL